jgi:hypothetical protein
MCEHTFPGSNYIDADASATTCAADLLERLLDQMSRRDHDWTSVARDTSTLAQLAAHMACLQRTAAGDA